MLSVLFVCTGNICRSPLAEGFLNDRSLRVLGGRVRARSAGTWARGGHPATGETVTAGSEVGLDLHLHQASPLAPELIDAADVVLGMTTEHRDEVMHLVPAATEKTFTLKELVGLLSALDEPPPAGNGPDEVRARLRMAHELRTGRERPRIRDEDVMDPLGLSLEVYRGVASEIEELVDALVRHLFGVSETAGAEHP